MEISELSAMKLLEIGRIAARRAHLGEADAEDCAMEFAHKALSHRSLRLLRGDSTRLLQVTARNLACDFARANYRRALHEVSEYAGSKGEADAAGEASPIETAHINRSSDSNDPEVILLADECRQYLMHAILQLRPTPRMLFFRYYIGCESLDAIAESMGGSKEAVRRSIRRAARQIGCSLERRGYGDEDFCRYFVFAQISSDELKNRVSNNGSGKRTISVLPLCSE